MEREFSWIESNSQYDEATVESLPSKPPGGPRWICLQCRRPRFSPWVGKIPWRREWQPHSKFLPGEFHGQRSLVDYSLWGHKELDRTEWQHFLFHYRIKRIWWFYVSSHWVIIKFERLSGRWYHLLGGGTGEQISSGREQEKELIPLLKQQLELDMEQQTGSK